tara:strand:- start:1680 stop:1856 length:177 start_codon:yes stop_codon:yes gene_type:complete
MADIETELKSAVVVAEASTKALGRSILIGAIPIIEFGLLITITLLIAKVPAKIFRKVA